MDTSRDSPTSDSGGKQSTAAWVVNGLAAAFKFAARVADPHMASFIDELDEAERARQMKAALAVVQKLNVAATCSEADLSAFANAKDNAAAAIRRAIEDPTVQNVGLAQDLQAQATLQANQAEMRRARRETLKKTGSSVAQTSIVATCSEGEGKSFDEAKATAAEAVKRAMKDPSDPNMDSAQKSHAALGLLAKSAKEAEDKRITKLQEISEAVRALTLDNTATEAEAKSFADQLKVAESALGEAGTQPSAERLKVAEAEHGELASCVESALKTRLVRKEALEALSAEIGKVAKLVAGCLPSEEAALSGPHEEAAALVKKGISHPTEAFIDEVKKSLAALEKVAADLNLRIETRLGQLDEVSKRVENYADKDGLISLLRYDGEKSEYQEPLKRLRQKVAKAKTQDDVDAAASELETIDAKFSKLVAQIDDGLRDHLTPLQDGIDRFNGAVNLNQKEQTALANAQRMSLFLVKCRTNIPSLKISSVNPKLQETLLIQRELDLCIQARFTVRLTPEQIVENSRARVLRYLSENVPLKAKSCPWNGRMGPELDVTVDKRDNVLYQRIRAQFHGKAIEIPPGKTYNGRELNPQATVTYYVTFSSKSGFAFDICGHIWYQGVEQMAAIFVLHVTNKAESYVGVEIDAGRL